MWVVKIGINCDVLWLKSHTVSVRHPLEKRHGAELFINSSIFFAKGSKSTGIRVKIFQFLNITSVFIFCVILLGDTLWPTWGGVTFLCVFCWGTLCAHRRESPCAHVCILQWEQYCMYSTVHVQYTAKASGNSYCTIYGLCGLDIWQVKFDQQSDKAMSTVWTLHPFDIYSPRYIVIANWIVSVFKTQQHLNLLMV